MSERIFQEHSFSGFAGVANLVAHTFGRRDIATKKIVTCGAGEEPDGMIHDDFEAGRGATLDMDGYPLRAKVGVGGVVAATRGMVGAGGTLVTWTAGNVPVCIIHTTVAEGGLAEIELLPKRSFVPQANIVALTDNTAGAANDTLQVIPDPADAPATADALRDDIVANVLPALRNNYADLAAKVNALIALADAHKLTL